MISPKAFGIAVLAIVMSCAHLTAQSSLFVVSRPLGANIVVNGVPKAQKTPVLYRFDDGRYDIELTKPGYPAVSATVSIEGSIPQSIELNLETGQVQSLFLTDDPIVIGGVSQGSGNSLLRVPYAAYEIRGDGDSLYIDPVFPRQGLLDATNVLFPVVAAVTLGAVVADVLSPEQPSLSVSPSIIAGSAATLTLASLQIILRIQRQTFLRDFAVAATQQRDSYTEAGPTYARAEDLLAAGDLDAALSEYSEVIGSFPEAPEYPLALYKAARIFSVRGELDASRLLYRHIVDVQQHPEVYDKAAKQLADLAFLSAEYEAALGFLDRMVFLDPILSAEDADAYRTEIQNARARDAEAGGDE